jgi:hypothetical protein
LCFHFFQEVLPTLKRERDELKLGPSTTSANDMEDGEPDDDNNNFNNNFNNNDYEDSNFNTTTTSNNNFNDDVDGGFNSFDMVVKDEDSM